MSPFFLAFLLALIASSGYAAGRLHGQLGYRTGYRQGHADRAREQFKVAVRALQDASKRNAGPGSGYHRVVRGRAPLEAPAAIGTPALMAASAAAETRAAVGVGISAGGEARHRRSDG